MSINDAIHAINEMNDLAGNLRLKDGSVRFGHTVKAGLFTLTSVTPSAEGSCEVEILRGPLPLPDHVADLHGRVAHLRFSGRATRANPYA